jgi:hypothetical protein
MKRNNIYSLLLLILIIIGCKKPPTEPPQKPSDSLNDFVWTIDSVDYTLPGLPHADQVMMNCIWGSSNKNIFAVGHSDVGGHDVYHYDGKKWIPAYLSRFKWPVDGTDNLGYYYVRPMAVTGFDSTDILLGCSREYDAADTAVAMILRWNGSSWIDVPFSGGIRAAGGIGWLVKDIYKRAWAVTAAGLVVRYENGLCFTEPRFTDYRLTGPVIVATDDGKVYVNAYKDSLKDNQLQGQICNLFERDIDGQWQLIEHKIIKGSYYDDNGLGLGAIGIGNRIFTINAGIWERINNSWSKISPPSYMDYGGSCLTNEKEMWFYFNYDLYKYYNGSWEKIDLPVLNSIPGGFLYGQGWSDGKEIFIPAIYHSKTFYLHGKK